MRKIKSDLNSTPKLFTLFLKMRWLCCSYRPLNAMLVFSPKLEHSLLGNKRGSVIDAIHKHFCKTCFCFYLQDCSQTFSGENGLLRSPNHPDNHPALLNCSYLICVPKEKLVSLRFTHFDLERDAGRRQRFHVNEFVEKAEVQKVFRLRGNRNKLWPWSWNG